MSKSPDDFSGEKTKKSKSIDELLLDALFDHQNGRLIQAAQIYQDILDIDPCHCDALQLLGTIALQNKNFQQAFQLLSRAVSLRQDFPQAHNNLGIALQELGSLIRAVEQFTLAIHLAPDYVEAINNRAIALQRNKQISASLRDFDLALSIKPNYADALMNRGLAFQDALLLDSAIQSFDQALVVDPKNTEAPFAKALVLLLAGKYGEGWIAHEARWQSKSHKTPYRNYTKPQWRGEEFIKGQVLFVFGEQGLGDTIQFSRYLPLLTELGVRVVFEAAHTLHGLLQPLIGDNTLIKPGDLVPEFDYFCPLMSLPLGFKTALSTIPHSKSYLQAPPEKKSLWADRLGPRLRPRVGIAWSGNSTHNKDGERSIPLQFLIEELFGLPFEFVSLQKEIRPTDESSLSGTLNLRRFESDIQDFGDTAALCTLMDLVISVDTSVAHLSAALGCQTWVLLAHSPDWRWLTERADSPWYPSVNLFRQSSDWDWRAVLKNVAIKISQLNM